jgi:hypothetical protein
LPTVAALNTVFFVLSADRSRRLAAIVCGSLTILAPFLLELAGVLPPTMTFRDGSLVLLPHVAGMPQVPTLACLVVTNLAAIWTAAYIVARFRDALASTEERLYFHTWQLRQFVPGEAYPAVMARTTTGATSLTITHK